MRTLSFALITGLAVATVSVPTPAAAQGRERDRTIEVTIPDLDLSTIVTDALASARVGLAMAGPTLANLRLQLDGLRDELHAAPWTGSLLWDFSPGFPFERSRRVPPAPVDAQDPADSLYRAGRQALNRSNYGEAATLFEQIRTRHPRSSYTPDAWYWEAWARYRRGSGNDLSTAVRLLDQQAQRHPDAATRGDASELLTRVLGELGRQGDAEASRRVSAMAREATVRPPAPPRPPRTPRPPRVRSNQDACRDEGDGVQSAALNAVLQMDADRAVPLLKRVLERKDPESACLRRRAVFMLSQHETAETSGLLVQLAKTDPDSEVRSQAVFWLSQVSGLEAVAALRDILATSTDRELQEKAIFALSQHEGPAASQALRTYAGRTDVPDELRSNAVFWLGQQGSSENAAFLRDLFGRAADRELKNRIIFSVSQMESAESGRWLVEVAKDARQPTEIRKQALFWAGQSDALTTADLKGLYGTMPDRELKEHLIFVLSQQDGPAAVDELIAIVRTEPDAELKKKAIFWLAQSDDPRVAEVLANLLDAPTRRP